MNVNHAMALMSQVPASEHDSGVKRFLNFLRAGGVAAGDVTKVDSAILKARAAGVSLLQIMLTLAPFVLQLLMGGKIDIQALIAAILALIPKP